MVLSLRWEHPPSDAELGVLVKLYNQVNPLMQKTNHKDPVEPNEGLTLVASAILNLDEFVTKN